MIKRILKFLWRAGVQETKPSKRQIIFEDEFSKKSLIGEEEEYGDMSDMVDIYGKELEEEDVDSIFKALQKNND